MLPDFGLIIAAELKKWEWRGKRIGDSIVDHQASVEVIRRY